MLVETFRAVENQDAMLDAMQEYVRLFPDDPRSPGYRAFLMRHGR